MADGQAGRPLVRRRAAGSVAGGAPGVGGHGGCTPRHCGVRGQHLTASRVVRCADGAHISRQAGGQFFDASLTLAFFWRGEANHRIVCPEVCFQALAEQAFDVDMGESPLSPAIHPWITAQQTDGTRHDRNPVP